MGISFLKKKRFRTAFSQKIGIFCYEISATALVEDFAWRVEPAWNAWHKNSGYRGVCFLSVLSLLCGLVDIVRESLSIEPTRHPTQKPRKHFESGGALTKRGTFVYDQNQTILWCSRAERKFFKIWSLYNVGNGLYESLLLRKGHFLSRKRGRLFKKYFFRSLNGAFKPRKKGTFFTFKKSGGGGHRPSLAPGSAAPDHRTLQIALFSQSKVVQLFFILQLILKWLSFENLKPYSQNGNTCTLHLL
jgi:hypothetical protein